MQIWRAAEAAPQKAKRDPGRVGALSILHFILEMAAMEVQNGANNSEVAVLTRPGKFPRFS